MGINFENGISLDRSSNARRGNGPSRLDQLQLACPRISASLLPIKDDKEERIIRQCIASLKVGLDMIHFDIIGGGGKRTCVVEEGSVDTQSELTPELLVKIRKAADEQGLSVITDVHLMDEDTSNHDLMNWCRAGADYVVIHWEASRGNEERTKSQLQVIRGHGTKSGLAIRPDVDIERVIQFLQNNPGLVDLINQNGVLPCFGGQTLQYSILDNIRRLDQVRQKTSLNFLIMVDGGIEPEISGPKCFTAGADILVAGSAFFGRGNRDSLTLHKALEGLRASGPVPEGNIYDLLARDIKKIQKNKPGKIWVLVEAYHGGGKTYTAERLAESLFAHGMDPVIVGGDLSWTDRAEREQWRHEAYEARAKGEDHNYFHPLNQSPIPMHWRKLHSESMLAQIAECDEGDVWIDKCYQFNLLGDTNGQVKFTVRPDSVIIFDCVYGSCINREWDYKIYIDADKQKCKERAKVRDAIKVRRSPNDTAALYEDVYKDTYDEYTTLFNPRTNASVVIDHNEVDESMIPKNARIVETSRPLLLLECGEPSCHTQRDLQRINVCSTCGGELWNRIVGPIDFLKAIDESTPSMWRYRELLPVDPENIVTAYEGFTPVKYLERLSQSLGVNIWAKMEIENPTGTFKDREASYVVSLSKQYGQKNIVMQSTGNTAMAITHYAGLAQIPSWSFIPEKSRYKLYMPPKKPWSRIVAVDGHPIDVKAVAEDFAACFNYPKISPFFERCEANVTMGYEVAEELLRGTLEAKEALRGAGFDYYVQTLSAGMGLIGFHEAMRRVSLWSGGKIKVPHIAAIEISEFAPAHAAWEADKARVGEEVATPLFPDHELFEPTLWTTNIARYYPHLRNMLKSSEGILSTITPDETLMFQEDYGIREALEELGYKLSDTEKAPLIGYAGLVKNVRSGVIPKGSNVILMITGKGVRQDFVLEKADFLANPKIHRPFDIFNGCS